MIKVTFLGKMGTDLTSVNAARISFNKRSKSLNDKDINYLVDHPHMGVVIDCPLYIRYQIMRYRTFAYDEVPSRYISENLKFYLPKLGDVRKQSPNNRQASGENLSLRAAMRSLVKMTKLYNLALNTYDSLIANGVCREQALGVLPQSLMTQFYMTGSLRNWANFVELRLDEGVQAEVKVVAEGVRGLLLEHFPISSKALLGETKV